MSVKPFTYTMGEKKWLRRMRAITDQLGSEREDIRHKAQQQAVMSFVALFEGLGTLMTRMERELEYLQRPPAEIAAVMFREPINRNTFAGPDPFAYYEMAMHKAASACGLEPIEDRHQMIEAFKWFMLTHGLVLRFSPRFRTAKMLDKVDETWLLEAMNANELFNEMAQGVYLMWAEGGDKKQLGERMAKLAAGAGIESALPKPPDDATPRQLPPPE